MSIPADTADMTPCTSFISTVWEAKINRGRQYIVVLNIFSEGRLRDDWRDGSKGGMLWCPASCGAERCDARVAEAMSNETGIGEVLTSFAAARQEKQT